MRFRRLACVLLVAAAMASDLASAEDAPSPFRWDGLARRNPGLVLFRSRWNPGRLEIRDDLLRWTDRSNPGKNLLLPVQRLTAHALVCPRGDAAACTEWRVATKTETYVFREAPARDGAALRAAFNALRGAYPDVSAEEKR